MSAKLFGHHIHPMLIAFPIGMLGGSVGFDIAFLVTDNERWADIAFWMLAAGVVSGLIAAPFGTYDWLSIPRGTRAKRIGIYHGATAVSAIALFAVSSWLRYETPTAPDEKALILSFAAATVLLVASWLGGELVERMAIGVDQGAHMNSPSSLSNRPASENERSDNE